MAHFQSPQAARLSGEPGNSASLTKGTGGSWLETTTSRCFFLVINNMKNMLDYM
jgi:hypothetical protein